MLTASFVHALLLFTSANKKLLKCIELNVSRGSSSLTSTWPRALPPKHGILHPNSSTSCEPAYIACIPLISAKRKNKEKKKQLHPRAPRVPVSFGVALLFFVPPRDGADWANVAAAAAGSHVFWFYRCCRRTRWRPLAVNDDVEVFINPDAAVAAADARTADDCVIVPRLDFSRRENDVEDRSGEEDCGRNGEDDSPRLDRLLQGQNKLQIRWLPIFFLIFVKSQSRKNIHSRISRQIY